MTTEVRQANVDDQGNFKVDLPTSGARLAAVLDNVEATLNTNDATNKLLAANLARHILAKILDEAKPVAISDTRTMLKLQHLIAISEPLELSARINGTISGVQNFSKSAYQSVDAIVAEGLHLATDYQKDPIHTLSAVTKDVKHFINSIGVRDTLEAINGWGKADDARRASILRIDDPQQRVFAQNERDAEILSNGLTAAAGLSGAAKIGGNVARKIATKFDDLPFDGVLVAEGVGVVGAKTTASATNINNATALIGLGAVAMSGFWEKGGKEHNKRSETDTRTNPFEKEYLEKRALEREQLKLLELEPEFVEKIRMRRNQINTLSREGQFNLLPNNTQFEDANHIKYELQYRQKRFQEHIKYLVDADPKSLPDQQRIHALHELLDNYPRTKDTKKLMGLFIEELNDYANLARNNLTGEHLPKNTYFGSDRNTLFRGGATVDLSSNIKPPEL